ncbi:ATP-binding cassette domain-containing protein [Phytohabitans sp. ZYX-F-186]|uniref:ATP-binding cassette domain-containing protein n=1 Tax=Phytohabitans maris TaxID=3071409 RepID=A0ABU0ZLZ2_9ACTN|nr:ATP-binding cassette domain-containing protein [Phytohabitans sp. ZYX-F-186]MDQ7908059.1 ATP-binding cassette domain-containing protein [Phytohabitans sp. ZYX-F-186]
MRVRHAVAAGTVAAFVVAGVAGPLLTGGRERRTDLGRALLAPGLDAWLGTDHLGRDELVRVVAGARGSVVAVGVVLLMCLLLGGGVGVVAGWRGGLLDRALLRLVDVVTSVPTLLLGLVLAGLLGGGPVQVALALGLTLWPPYARVVRTETRLRRGEPSNQALRLLGAGPARILLRHILPSLGGPVVVLLGITAAEVIVAVATLSFLGLGAQPPAPEWGTMLVESRPYLSTAPWLFLAPATAVAAVAVAGNLLADRLGGWFTHGTTRTAGKSWTGAAAKTAAAPEPGGGLRIAALTVDVNGARVVAGATLTAPPGGTLAIVGPSGSGKTMTVLGALGLFPPHLAARVGGSARVAGHELVGLGEAGLRAVRGRVVAYVPQDVGSTLNPLRRVGAQLASAVTLHSGSRSARELLALVGIEDPERVARQRPGELSGGMRQRVLLALALAGEPQVLIADEPTSALDATAAVGVVELLRRIQRRLGTTLVVITHELGMAARLADTIAVFDAGRVVESGPASTVLSRPGHAVTRSLVAAADLPDPPAAPPPSGPPLLTARDLRVTYPGRDRRPPVTALAGVGLTVRRGEVVAVVGNSGCGKSTLARALAGIEPRRAGTVTMDGQRIHLVFQDPAAALDRRQAVGPALDEALQLHRVPSARIPARRTALLERVGLTGAHAERRPWQLSGGERQRAVLARALAGEPDLLILDEPVSALDSTHRAAFIRLLRQLRGDGPSMLLISHDLGVVEQLADRVLVMHAGRIVDELPAGQDRHPVTRDLLAARDYFRHLPTADPEGVPS